MNKRHTFSLQIGTLSMAALISALGLVITGCGQKQGSPNAIDQTEAIKRLDYRLQQLEQRMGDSASPGIDPGEKTPTGPVKSLTLRMGTVDDRLRIYWADGTTSNLPCTKEQNTWACG